MRSGLRLLVACMTFALVACSGGEEAPPIGERFPTAADAPGTTPDPEETRQLPEDLDAFTVAFRDALIDPDSDEMTTIFEDAGFVAAGLDVRFFGETHAPPETPHLFSWFIELESEDGAEDVLDWVEAETIKPCPESCATQVSFFDVDRIADARGIKRLATEEMIETAGTENEQPHEGYWVGFAVGSVVYTVDLIGPPGSVSEEQVEGIVSAFHDRITAD